MNSRVSLFLFLFPYLATKAALDTDIALYIGLSVAVAVVIVFSVIGVVMLRILRRKHGGHSPMFPVGASGTVFSLFCAIFFLPPSYPSISFLTCENTVSGLMDD